MGRVSVVYSDLERGPDKIRCLELSRLTGGHINQDPPYTQKPIYYTFFASYIWSLLLRSPVIVGCLRGIWLGYVSCSLFPI